MLSTAISGFFVVLKVIWRSVKCGRTVSDEVGSLLGRYPSVRNSWSSISFAMMRVFGLFFNIDVMRFDAAGPTVSSGMTYSVRLMRLYVS